MMDTSETYIKMCDCPEIQNEEVRSKGYQLRPPSEGDFYAYKRYGKYKWQSVIDYSRKHSMMGHPVYLPRQDQIQEMFGEVANLRHFSGLIEGFFRFSATGYGVEQKTFEQLWLAFYMYEKRGKVWNGEKWRKKQ